MSGKSFAEHNGVVEAVKFSAIMVIIKPDTACDSCCARSACNVLEKRIEVQQCGQDVCKGDIVRVILRSGGGLKAVWWAYACPLCILMLVLMLLQSLQWSDICIGISAVIMLVIYYSVLYLFRNTFKKNYIFEIEKI